MKKAIKIILLSILPFALFSQVKVNIKSSATENSKSVKFYHHGNFTAYAQLMRDGTDSDITPYVVTEAADIRNISVSNNRIGATGEAIIEVNGTPVDTFAFDTGTGRTDYIKDLSVAVAEGDLVAVRGDNPGATSANRVNIVIEFSRSGFSAGGSSLISDSGSFIPTVTDPFGTGWTFSSQSGKYNRVGDIVTYHGTWIMSHASPPGAGSVHSVECDLPIPSDLQIGDLIGPATFVNSSGAPLVGAEGQVLEDTIDDELRVTFKPVTSPIKVQFAVQYEVK